MKEQYTAADMASAAAQGFRAGMKRAADICNEISFKPDNRFSDGADICWAMINDEINDGKQDD